METTAVTRQFDELLLPFLQAPDGAESERRLALLLEEHAAPVVRGVVKNKLRVSMSPGDGREENQDALDVCGDVYADLLTELHALKSDAGGRAISNFRSYVAGVAYNACHRRLRKKYPRRHGLKTRLRYLLTRHAPFALWESDEHTHLCGLAPWHGREAAPQTAALSDLATRARERLGAVDAQRMQLADLLPSVFDAAGGPVELDELVDAVADLQGVTEQQAREDSDEQQAQAQLPDARAGVGEELEQRLYVARLWEEICGLPRNQRAALLLNLRDARGRDLISLLPYTGVAGVRGIAEALDIPAEEFAALWQELPLEDACIAARLGVTRQQVINLRKSARARLGRRMKDF
jgi:DNA-directed RNA polymerase specialized sigma24 family protein